VKAMRFVSFEVHGVTYEHGTAVICGDAVADFFSVYGQLRNAHGDVEYICVGDFNSRELADLIVSLIPLDGPRI
jgi:hypothetical protein